MSFDQSPQLCDLGQSPALAGPFEPAPANYLRDARLHPTLPERHDSELPKLDKLIRVYDKTWASGDALMMCRLCRSLVGRC